MRIGYSAINTSYNYKKKLPKNWLLSIKVLRLNIKKSVPWLFRYVGR